MRLTTALTLASLATLLAACTASTGSSGYVAPGDTVIPESPAQ